MKNYLKQRKDQLFGALKNERGQGLVEYALILVLVSIVVIAALTNVGEQVNNVFERVDSTLTPQN